MSSFKKIMPVTLSRSSSVLGNIEKLPNYSSDEEMVTKMFKDLDEARVDVRCAVSSRSVMDLTSPSPTKKKRLDEKHHPVVIDLTAETESEDERSENADMRSCMAEIENFLGGRLFNGDKCFRFNDYEISCLEDMLNYRCECALCVGLNGGK